MHTSNLKSIWRGVGHAGALCSLFGIAGLTVLPFLVPPRFWAGIIHEIADGFWGHWLRLLALTFGCVILTLCCYRAASEKPILKLMVTYFVVATLMCVVRDLALIAVGNAGPIIVQWDPTPLDANGPPWRTYSVEAPKPSLGRLLESVWLFAAPLAPVMLLWGLAAKSRRWKSHNSG